MPHLVSPAEAASRAGAAYVRRESYRLGAEEGWAAGWAAAVAETHLAVTFSTSHSLECEPPRGPEALSSDANAPPQNAGACEGIELSAEWASLFIAGEARREAKRKRSDDSFDYNGKKRARVPLELGGAAAVARSKAARRLYGAEAQELLEEEADLLGRFDEMVAKTRASFWPVISIRDAEAPVLGTGFP